MNSTMMLNESGRWLVAQLGRMSVELAILAGVVLVALYVLRVKSPALRHLFWGLLLAKPVLTFLVASPLSLYAFLWPPTPEVFFTPMPVTQTIQAPLPLRVVPTPDAAPPAAAPRPDTPPFWRQIDRYGLATLAWTLVASLLGLRLLLGCAYVALLRTTARTRREGILAELLAEAAATLRVRRRVAIATTTVCHGPVLAGIFRPVILLPETMAAALTEPQLKLVITHELAHARRWDNLVLLVQRLAEMLFFFHPVVWLCGWMMRREAEAACDDIVVSAYGDADGTGAAAYADSLTRVAEMKCGITHRLLVNTFAAAESNFHRRIRRILGGRRTRMTLGLSLATGAALVAIGVLGLPTVASAPPPQNHAENQGKALDEPGSIAAPENPDTTAGAYATPEGGYTHLVTFEPAGELHPRTPKELLDVFDGACKAKTGYFRTTVQDGTLVGRICTDAASEVQKALEGEPRLKWVEAVPLTPELFAQHSAGKQDSLPERSEVEKILDTMVSLEFENVHLSDIVNFISDSYDINMDMDWRAVAPPSKPGTAAQPGPGRVSNGMVPRINLKNVELRDALIALLRPLNLAFRAEPSIVWISSPDLLEADAKRPQPILKPASETLAKELQTPVSIQFQDTDLYSIIDYISDSFDVNFMLDWRVIPPKRQSPNEPGADSPAFVTDAHVPHISLRNTPLAEALHALLRPLNLTFKADKDVVWISSDAMIDAPPSAQANPGNAGAVSGAAAQQAPSAPASPASAANFVADLQNGRSIELVAVRRTKPDGASFWRPDGSPLAEAPYDHVNDNVASEGKACEFVFRMAGIEGVSAVNFHFDGSSGCGTAPALAKDGAVVPGITVATVFLSANPAVENVRLHVVSGEWKPVLTHDPDKGSIASYSGDGYFAAFAEPYEKDNATCVTLTLTDRIAESASRLTALDNSGISHTGSLVAAGGNDKGVQQQYRFVGMKPADVKTFQIETCPWQEVQFTNISLVPGEHSDCKVLVAASAHESRDSAPSGASAEAALSRFRMPSSPRETTARGKSEPGPLVVAPLIGYLDDKVRAEWQSQGIADGMAVFGKLQEQTIVILRARLDRAGLQDVKIEKRANGRIDVQTPPSLDARRVASLTVQPGVVRFCPAAARDEMVQSLTEAEKDPRFQGRLLSLVDAKPQQAYLTVPKDRHAAAEKVLNELNSAQPALLPEGKMFCLGSKGIPDTLYLVDKNSPMVNVKVQSATATPDTDNPGKARINFTLSDEDAQRFGELTQSLIGKGLAILFDWEVQSAPVVRDRITKSGQITGNYTMEEATDLAACMSAPEYPVPLVVLSDPAASPPIPAQVGVEDIRKALEARYYERIDAGLFDGTLRKCVLPVYDPATGEELSSIAYEKDRGHLAVRNLPENLAVFEQFVAQISGSKAQTPYGQKNENAAPPAPEKPAVEMLTLEVRIIDETGAPVEGAAVEPYALRTRVEPGSHYGWRTDDFGPQQAGTTNAQGIAQARYPRYTIERMETGQVSVKASHPDFVVKLQDLTVDTSSQTVTLVRGTKVRVSGYVGNKENTAWPIYAMRSNDSTWQPEPWKTSGSALEDGQLPPGKHHLWVIHEPQKGPTLFSDTVYFETSSAAATELSVELRPGMRVEGRIDDTLPRPIRNGRVEICVASLSPEENESGKREFLCWRMLAPLGEDGRFTFDSLPKGYAEIAAWCEGGIVAYTGGKGSASLVHPLPVDLTGSAAEIIVPMIATASATVKTEDAQGHPIEGVSLSCWPNIQWVGRFTTVALPSALTSLQTLGMSRQELEQAWSRGWKDNPYTVTTGLDGIATIRNLPPFTNEFSANKDGYELPLNDSEPPRHAAKISLAPGKDAAVTVQLQPKKTPAPLGQTDTVETPTDWREDFERYPGGESAWPDTWIADGNAADHKVNYIDGTTFKKTHGNTLRLHGDTPAWSPLAHILTRVKPPFRIAFDVFLESKDPKCTCVVGVRKEPGWTAPGVLLFDTIPPGSIKGLEPVAAGGVVSKGQSTEQLHMELGKWHRVELILQEEPGRQTLTVTLDDGAGAKGPIQLSADSLLVKDMPYLQLEVRSGTAWFDNVSMSPVSSDKATPWRAAFENLYMLKEGEVLKRIAPPFIPERVDWYRSLTPGQADSMPRRYMALAWDNGKVLRMMESYGCAPDSPVILGEAVSSLTRLTLEYLEAPQDLLNMEVPGDWVVRYGADTESILRELARILRDELRCDVQFTKANMEREVIVASGAYAFAPVPDIKGNEEIHLFADVFDPNSGDGGSAGTTVPEFLDTLGDRMSQRIVDETTPTGDKTKPLHFHPMSSLHAARFKAVVEKDGKELERLRSLFLANVAKQTGLQFSTQRRSVPVWVLARNGATPPVPTDAGKGIAAPVSKVTPQGDANESAAAAPDDTAAFADPEPVPQVKADKVVFSQTPAPETADVPQYTAELKLMAGPRESVDAFCARLRVGREIERGPEAERVFSTDDKMGIEAIISAGEKNPDLELLSAPRVTFKSRENATEETGSPWSYPLKIVARDINWSENGPAPEALETSLGNYSTSFLDFFRNDKPTALIMDYRDALPKRSDGGKSAAIPEGVAMGVGLHKTDLPNEFSLSVYFNAKEVTHPSRGLAFWKPTPPPEIFESPVVLRMMPPHPYRLGDWIVVVTKNRDPKKATLAVLHIQPAPPGIQYAEAQS